MSDNNKKLILLTVIPIIFAIGIAFFISSSSGKKIEKDSEVLLSFTMKDKNWKDLGIVSEPLISLPIKTTSGYKKNSFLLDSGAVISSLPREWAAELGLDLAFLPRSTFGGFGGATSIAYQGEMVVLLGSDELTLPVVFTEAVGTKSLIGRKGFFNRYSILFDHRTKQVEIRG